MSARSRTLLFLALAVVLAGFAAAPLFSAGFLGEDLPFLLRGSDLAWPDGSHRVADLLWSDAGGPLANLSLALSSRLESTRGAWDGSEATFVRAENLLLLLAASACLGLAARRALAPWTGAAGAQAAALAIALLVACHPLCVPVVAGIAHRGDLLALIFGGLCAGSFLRARQDRAHGAMALAVAAACLAGLSSGLAVLLPLALALLELTSARRHRSWHLRARTAATTFVVFAGCVGAEALLALALGGRPDVPVAAREIASALAPARLGSVLTLSFEKLGWILLPVPRGAGAHLWIVAGALLLLAVQPSLAAARAAPRLWGWLAFTWCVSVALALLVHASERVEPGDLSRAALLLPAAVVVSTGLAIAATALSGSRRVWIPIVIAVGYAALAHESARSWPATGKVLGDLRAELWAAQSLHGREARILVVDPPGKEGGLDVLSASLPLLADPRLAGGGSGAVHGLSRAALLALVSEPEFEALRREPLVILAPADFVRPGAGGSRTPILLPPPSASSGPLVWREEGRSTNLDLDSLENRVVRVTARPGASTGRAPRMEWRSGAQAASSATPSGFVDGVWITGPDGAVAMFDLSRRTDWLFGPRIRRIWFDDDLAKIVSAEVLPGPPALEGSVSPIERGDAWVFDAQAANGPRPIHVEDAWVLGLLDVRSLRYLEIRPIPAAAGELVFPDARAFARECAGPLSWSLELRAGEVALARVSGRR